MELTKEPGRIQSMFGQIAGRYDLANSILSMGIHHHWRKKLVSWSDAHAGDRVLDCATGTGDLALVFKKAVGIKGSVIGTDFCAEMIAQAPAKAERADLHVDFQQADVMQLPFANAQFDVVSIAFGIRNVANVEKALHEMARVTKTGGRVMILEFGQPSFMPVEKAFNFYSSKVLPKVGGWITGHPEAYEYLQVSSKAFPCGPEFCERILATGDFSKVEFQPLSMGIAYLYRAQVSR